LLQRSTLILSRSRSERVEGYGNRRGSAYIARARHGA
jgi:hypothetical protein